MEIDKSKENIQPLRGGRNMQQLSLALTAQADPHSRDTLQHQQQAFEEEITNYDGPDPLDPWFNYIQWIEQSYPKHGHEGQIEKILKECLTKFENDEHYKQDRRYLKLWIKYIDFLNNPLNMYQLLYSTGIGTTCSELYRAWANYCEEVGDYKKADIIYNYGLQAHAEPIDELKEAHVTFQTWVAQRLLHDDSPTKRKAATALAETRHALTSLKSVKRRNIAVVPSERIGDNIHSYPPGAVRQTGAVNQPKSNIMIDIYQDEPGTSADVEIPSAVSANPSSLLQSCDIKENQKEVGIWSNPSNKNGKLGTGAKTMNPAVPFEFFEDDRTILSSKHQQFCSDDFSDFIVAMCVPDPADNTKISMYNKKEVYKEMDNGMVKEFSLEEIRARKYLTEFMQKKQALMMANNVPLIQNTHYNKMEESQTNTPAFEYGDAPEMGTNMEFNLENVIKQSNSILNADSPSEMLPEGNNMYNIGYGACKPQDYGNSQKCDNVPSGSYGTNNDENNFASNNPKKNILDDFNRSLMSNINASMTVHTREAVKELNNLFGGNVADVSVKPTLITPQSQPLKFEIHEDTSMTMASKKGFENGRNYDQYEKQDVEKTSNFDVTCSTQAFNFNIPGSTSTPFTSHFKKPCFADGSKISSIKKLNIDADGDFCERQTEHTSQGAIKENEAVANGQPDGENHGLSVIMETTREHRSGSSSSGSYQTTRNTFGYTARESCGPSLGVIIEKSHQESNSEISMSSYQQTNDANYYNRQQNSFNQNRVTLPAATPKMTGNEKVQQLPYNNVQKPVQPSAYPATDSQYLKNNSYNGYNIQRNSTQEYPQTSNANAYQIQPNYQRPSANATGYQTVYPHQNVAYQNQNYTQQQAVVSNPQHVQNHHVDYQQVNGQQQQVQSPYHNYQNQHNYSSQSSPYSNNQQMYHSYQQQNMGTPQHNYQQQQHHYNQTQAQPVHQNYQSQIAHPGFQSPTSSTPEYNNSHLHYQSPPQAYQNTSHHQVYQQNQEQQQQQQHLYQNRSYSNVTTNYSVNISYSQNNSFHAPKPQTSAVQYNYQNQTPPQQSPQIHPQQSPQIHPQQSPQIHPQQTPPIHPHQSPQIQQYQQHVQMNQQVNNQGQKLQPQTHQQLQQQQYASYRNHQNNSYSLSQNAYGNANAYLNSSGHAMPNQSNNSISVPSSNVQHLNNSISQSLNVNQKQNQSYQTPTSKLRSVRHEVPHMANKANFNTPNPDFSNQYLNFISNRNEPKDNANTPKFGTSPNISQKMHKNLYVSSPEQGQVPPSTDSNSTDSLKSNNYSTTVEKQRDLSKRQLDFDNRFEFGSEDSRDSFGKDNRYSAMSSKMSTGSKTSIRTDNHQMDVDSENSTDCQNTTYKSNCSNSHISTQDIAMPAEIEFPKVIDPFNSKLCDELLEYVKFPNKNHYENCYEMVNVPKLQNNMTVTLGSSRYSIDKQLGKGSFGSVFRALELSTGRSVALKYQKPRHPWEFYICQEIKARVDKDFLRGYMDVDVAFIGSNATIFVSELSKYGSLLDVANKTRTSTNKCIHELIVMLLASEMLSILHYLHKAEIIHGDIKPDNFLIMEPPQMDAIYPCLQLIDFGCAIDMSLFPKGTSFTKVIQTSGFTCNEMRQGRPWTYQTDLYCLAGTVHAVLMGNYMQTANRGGKWNVEKKWPRYLKTAVWEKMFTTLLNVEDCVNFPDLLSLKDVLDDTLNAERGQLNNQLRLFCNVLKSR